MALNIRKRSIFVLTLALSIMLVLSACSSTSGTEASADGAGDMSNSVSGMGAEENLDQSYSEDELSADGRNSIETIISIATLLTPPASGEINVQYEGIATPATAEWHSYYVTNIDGTEIGQYYKMPLEEEYYLLNTATGAPTAILMDEAGLPYLEGQEGPSPYALHGLGRTPDKIIYAIYPELNPNYLFLFPIEYVGDETINGAACYRYEVYSYETGEALATLYRAQDAESWFWASEEGIVQVYVQGTSVEFTGAVEADVGAETDASSETDAESEADSSEQ